MRDLKRCHLATEDNTFPAWHALISLLFKAAKVSLNRTNLRRRLRWHRLFRSANIIDSELSGLAKKCLRFNQLFIGAN